MAAQRGRSEHDAEEVQTALSVSRSPFEWILANGNPLQYLRPPSNFPSR